MEGVAQEGGASARLNIVLRGNQLSRPVTVRVHTANIDATGLFPMYHMNCISHIDSK